MNTNKQKFYILVGILILLAANLIWPANAIGGEKPILQSTPSWEDTPTPEVVESQVHTPTELPIPSKGEIIAPVSEVPEHKQTEAEQLKRNEEIITQLEVLTAEANKKYMLPGWWHTVQQKEAFITASASFPNGDPIPKQSTIETWKFIDPDGYIDKSITSQDTGDPLTSTTSIYKDGVRTYGTGESRRKEKSLATSSGAPLLNELKKNKEIIIIEMNKVFWQGLETLAFTFTYRHSPLDSNPELSPDEEEKAVVIGTTIGTVYTHYVSVEDGYFVGHEVSFIYPDEQVKLASRSIFTVYEHIDQPPPEILAHFE